MKKVVIIFIFYFFGSVNAQELSIKVISDLKFNQGKSIYINYLLINNTNQDLIINCAYEETRFMPTNELIQKYNRTQIEEFKISHSNGRIIPKYRNPLEITDCGNKEYVELKLLPFEQKVIRTLIHDANDKKISHDSSMLPEGNYSFVKRFILSNGHFFDLKDNFIVIKASNSELNEYYKKCYAINNVYSEDKDGDNINRQALINYLQGNNLAYYDDAVLALSVYDTEKVFKKYFQNMKDTAMKTQILKKTLSLVFLGNHNNSSNAKMFNNSLTMSRSDFLKLIKSSIKKDQNSLKYFKKSVSILNNDNRKKTGINADNSFIIEDKELINLLEN